MKRAWRQETYRNTQDQMVEQKQKNMRKILKTESFGDGVIMLLFRAERCAVRGEGVETAMAVRYPAKLKNVCFK